MKKRYERTWCDYLTNCEHFPDIEIGSYECSQCKFHMSSKEQKGKEWETGDYGRYFELIEGEVECLYDDTSNKI